LKVALHLNNEYSPIYCVFGVMHAMLLISVKQLKASAAL